MRIGIRLAGFALGLASLLAAGTASAAYYTDRITGYVTNGSGTGLFGGNISGPFELNIVYDPNGPDRVIIPGVSDSTDNFISAALTINSQTHALPTFGFLGAIAEATPGALLLDYDTVPDDANPVWIEGVSVNITSPGLLPSLTPGTFGPASASGTGKFFLQLCCCPSCGPHFTGYQVSGDLNVTGLTISVPEPATWALLILGVAMTGFAVRRRSGGLSWAA